MKIQAQPNGNVMVLVAHGPLVGEELVDLRRAIETESAGQAKRVVLDLHDVPYLDSAGIEFLVQTCDLSVSAVRRPTLAALSETCREALELTDTLPRLPVYDTVENALRSCQR
jgi:anti-sigma B factor antagonist